MKCNCKQSPVAILFWLFVSSIIGVIIGKAAVFGIFWWGLTTLLSLASLYTIPIYVEQKRKRAENILNKLLDIAMQIHSHLCNACNDGLLRSTGEFIKEYRHNEEDLRAACHLQLIQNMEKIFDLACSSRGLTDIGQSIFEPVGYGLPDVITKIDFVRNKEVISKSVGNEKIYVMTQKAGNTLIEDSELVRNLFDAMKIETRFGIGETEQKIQWHKNDSEISKIEKDAAKYYELCDELHKAVYPRTSIKKWKCWILCCFPKI